MRGLLPALVVAASACGGGGVVEHRVEAPAESRPSTLGPLDPYSVMATIKRQYQREVVACYKSVLKKKPDVKGKAIVMFTVGPGGDVTEVAVDGFDPDVSGCIEDHARRWRFDAHSNPAGEKFQAPFVLAPMEAASPPAP